MRNHNTKRKGVIYVHSKWKHVVPGGYPVFSEIGDVPPGSPVIPPSPKAAHFFRSLGFRVLCEGSGESEVADCLRAYHEDVAKVSPLPEEARKTIDFKKQSEVVTFVESFLKENQFVSFMGRLAHVKESRIKADINNDYIVREILRHYDCTYQGKDYIPADRLCGLAVAGVSLREIDVCRPFPLYLPTPNPRVLHPAADTKEFRDKRGDLWESVERYFAVLRLPFSDLQSMASALAAMLTPLVYVPCSPIWVITSSTPGVGKTLLAQCAYALATGEILPVTPYPESDSEARKQITSALLSGRPALIWDNISRPLGGPSIDALTTSRSWRDRILGRSQMVELPKFLSLACTGNHVSLTADTFRRVIVTHLKPPDESPEKRYYSRDLVEECASLHKEFVVDALSWLSFFEKSKGDFQPKRGFGSFEGWNSTIGGFVEWLLGIHPADSSDTLDSEDRDILDRLLVNWPYQEPVETSRMIADASSPGMFGSYSQVFSGILKEISPKLELREILRWLKAREGLLVKGRSLIGERCPSGRKWSVSK